MGGSLIVRSWRPTVEFGNRAADLPPARKKDKVELRDGNITDIGLEGIL
ncbi:MAG TPA: hypothetical protein VK436_14540 [Methanocella sp.]|nr:hypothetical protein [Methanocella sp.]